MATKRRGVVSRWRSAMRDAMAIMMGTYSQQEYQDAQHVFSRAKRHLHGARWVIGKVSGLAKKQAKKKRKAG